ncbi:TetR/AcrR family transcriptional regulator [Streptomyces sp. NPDC101733]|uniref:TetR/AcrR family transcriptional regulator n=1 Tax=unclassified Streptomyces TaxID=2593676 RepID=UPI00381D61AB
MIVRAAMPLLAEHGTAVTTAEVARAAGIGEATIFRVFSDKAELIDACLADAARPERILTLLADIDPDRPLAERLTAGAREVLHYLGAVGAVVSALHATGHRAAGGSDRPGAGSGRQDGALGAVTEALAALIGPGDTAALRLPAEEVATHLFDALFGAARHGTPDEARAERVVDLVLHGALASPPEPGVAGERTR